MSETGEYSIWERDLRDPHSEAELCKQIGGLSAQSTVFLLPEHYNEDVYYKDGSFDAVEVERVIKIAHSYSQAADAVERLNLVDEPDRGFKAASLVIDGLSQIPPAIRYAAITPEINILMGHPKLCEGGVSAWHDGYHTAYVQDYAIPIAERLANFDIHNPEHFTEAMHLVDGYIDAQLLLIKHSLFEKTFKFTDNFGIFPDPEVFETDLQRIRLLDLGELSDRRQDVVRLIVEKDWEKIPERTEYTQMHPALQAYFNKQCEERLTEAVVMQTWGMHRRQNQRRIPRAQVYETRIPSGLPKILWQQAA